MTFSSSRSWPDPAQDDVLVVVAHSSHVFSRGADRGAANAASQATPSPRAGGPPGSTSIRRSPVAHVVCTVCRDLVSGRRHGRDVLEFAVSDTVIGGLRSWRAPYGERVRYGLRNRLGDTEGILSSLGGPEATAGARALLLIEPVSGDRPIA